LKSTRSFLPDSPRVSPGFPAEQFEGGSDFPPAIGQRFMMVLCQKPDAALDSQPGRTENQLTFKLPVFQARCFPNGVNVAAGLSVSIFLVLKNMFYVNYYTIKQGKISTGFLSVGLALFFNDCSVFFWRSGRRLRRGSEGGSC